MSFHVGQKVICIDDVPVVPGLSLSGLTKGHVYTIRQVLLACDSSAAVRLVEITRPNSRYPEDADKPYLARRFRPVVERETDISIFTRMLDPARVPEPVA